MSRSAARSPCPGRLRGATCAVLLLVSGSGCGYALVRYGKLPDGVRSVAIPTLRNDSYEPGVEYVVTDALRREFLRRGAVDLTEDTAGADLVVTGTVLPLRTTTASFSPVVLALEYEITLTLNLSAERADGTQIPIGDRALRESERYLVSADAQATRKNREEALRRVSRLLAGRVHDQLFEMRAR